MALEQFIKMYEGPQIQRVTSSVVRFPWPTSGTLKRIRIIGTLSLIAGNWYWNVRNNGTALFAGVDRPKFQTGVFDAEKSGLNVAVVEGQECRLDLEKPSIGRLSQPISLLVEIDDGTFVTKVIVFVTASIADLATGTGIVAVAKDFKFKRLTVSHHSRVRLYKTAAARTADASRLFGDRSYRGNQHKMIMDVNLTAGTGLDWYFSPAGLGENGDSPETSDIYYSVTNNSGGTQAITVTLEVLKEQE